MKHLLNTVVSECASICLHTKPKQFCFNVDSPFPACFAGKYTGQSGDMKRFVVDTKRNSRQIRTLKYASACP